MASSLFPQEPCSSHIRFISCAGGVHKTAAYGSDSCVRTRVCGCRCAGCAGAVARARRAGSSVAVGDAARSRGAAANLPVLLRVCSALSGGGLSRQGQPSEYHCPHDLTDSSVRAVRPDWPPARGYVRPIRALSDPPQPPLPPPDTATPPRVNRPHTPNTARWPPRVTRTHTSYLLPTC